MKKKYYKRILWASFALWFYWFFIPPFNTLRVGHAQVKKIWDEKSKTVSYEFTSEELKDWVPLKKISKNMIGAVIVSEDWNFYTHHGIDLASTRDAVKDALNGKKMRGASTISQQLVKNLFLSSSKSFVRKFREAIYTLALEQVADKNMIMEAYLNVIEYGEGIYGIHHAARYYFKKHPQFLTPKEAAFLAMILPAPKRFNASFYRHSLGPKAQRLIKKIIVRMRKGGHISSSKANSGLGERLVWEKFSPPAASTVFDEDQDLAEMDDAFSETLPETTIPAPEVTPELSSEPATVPGPEPMPEASHEASY